MEIEYTQFDALAAEKIQWYVYALRDPRNNEVFCIGKGKSNRWFDHIHEARKKVDDPNWLSFIRGSTKVANELFSLSICRVPC
jgi:hypothetical protein